MRPLALALIALAFAPVAGADDANVHLGIEPGVSTTDDVRRALGLPDRRYAHPVPADGFETAFDPIDLSARLDGHRARPGFVLAEVWEYGRGRSVTERVVFGPGGVCRYLVCWPDRLEESEESLVALHGPFVRLPAGPGSCADAAGRETLAYPALGVAFVRPAGDSILAWKVLHPVE